MVMLVAVTAVILNSGAVDGTEWEENGIRWGGRR